MTLIDPSHLPVRGDFHGIDVRIGMLQSKDTSAGVSLPELDGVVVPASGEDDLTGVVVVDHLQVVLGHRLHRQAH